MLGQRKLFFYFFIYNQIINYLLLTTLLNKMDGNQSGDDSIDCLVDNLAHLGVKQSVADTAATELDNKLKLHENTIGHSTKDLSNTNNIRLRLAHLLPQENLQYFCRDYFTDDDFLNETLELPQEILAEVAHSPSELIDYLKTMGAKLADELDMDNAIVFRQICDTYALILDYYSGCEYYGHSPDPGFWPDDFINRVWQFCVVIHQDYVLDTQSLVNTTRLEQELAHGIGMITTQIDLIKSHYAALAIECNPDNAILPPINLDDLTPEHADRFILLTNNLCVLMIFIKFYYSDGIQPDDLRFK